MYKSLDAGKTWTHIGLEDTQHIAKVLVSPQNPDIVYVAALGHAYGPNDSRGVFRSSDGGKTWQKILFKDNRPAPSIWFSTPTIRTSFSQRCGRRTHAMGHDQRRSRQRPSTNPATRRHLEAPRRPRPAQRRARSHRRLCFGRGWQPRLRHYRSGKGGIYSSDDAGDSWKLINPDHRFTQRAWYFHHISRPQHVDTIYVLNTGTSRSTDGGHTFGNLSVRRTATITACGSTLPNQAG